MTEYGSISTTIRLHKGNSFSLIKSTTALNAVSALAVGRFNEHKCSTATSFFVVQK